MELIGLWLTDVAAVELARGLGAQGFAVRRLSGPGDLTADLDGLVIGAGLIETHTDRLRSFREAGPARSVPVVAVIKKDADEAAVARALAAADETAREPVGAVELAARLRVLGRLRQALLAARSHDSHRCGHGRRKHASRTARVLRPTESAPLCLPVLDALDRLASGIAQEIQSPVQYVGGNLEFMGNTFMRLVEALDRLSAAALRTDRDETGLAAALAELLADEELRFLLEETPAAIRESHEGLRRVAAIVHAVSRLARPDGQDVRAVNVAEAVRDMLVVSRSVWKYVADVETAIAPELPAALLPPSALCRALLALLLHAAEAVDLRLAGRAGKGRIMVAVSRRGDALEVVVENAGPKPAENAGIGPEARAGLDRQLGRARGLLHRHGAEMDVVAGEAGETTVVVTLPLVLGQAAIGA